MDSFDPIDYLAYLRRSWHLAALAMSVAVVATGGFSFLLADRYTATATLLIDPPSANDPRGTTAVSSVYLESLKTYEEFATSDSLFAKACTKFQLAESTGSHCTESFKRSVLRVSKVKDTKILRISVSLPNPKQAQALVQYLAEQTVDLNRTLAQDGDRETSGDVRKQLSEARANLDKARAERDAAGSGGTEDTLGEQVRNLSELIARTDLELMRSRTAIAEDTAHSDHAELAGEQARLTALTQQAADYERKRAAATTALSTVRARQDRAEGALRIAENDFETWSHRVAETDVASGSRTERLRIIDPGVVPQQRSFPDPPLFMGLALVVSGVLSLTFLSLRYGWQRTVARAASNQAPRLDFTDIASELDREVRKSSSAHR